MYVLMKVFLQAQESWKLDGYIRRKHGLEKVEYIPTSPRLRRAISFF